MAPPASPSGSGQPQLSVDTETLVAFKQRVDGLLAQLEKGSTPQLGEQVVAGSSYGDSFPAAADLGRAYAALHDRLTALSKLLGDQVQAAGLSADVVYRGYQNVDQAHASQLLAIEARLQQSGRPPAPVQAAASPAGAVDEALAGSANLSF
ncbi:MAG: hypothetical protein JO362_09425 [Streptomycetaceae bacterium]|nr:hypothetical protein [Streptomycetaceae bacterium]